MAWIADGLTASRLVLGVVVGAAIASNHLGFAIVVLVIAWVTDLLDGPLARAASAATRLGDWDFRVDVTLGAAIFVGLAISGRVPAWLVAGLVVLGVGWTRVTGNPAPAMLFLAVVYAWFLMVVLTERPERWWLPFAAIPALLAIDHRRFFRVILPAFFKGLAAIGRGRAAEAPPVLDEWA